MGDKITEEAEKFFEGPQPRPGTQPSKEYIENKLREQAALHGHWYPSQQEV